MIDKVDDNGTIYNYTYDKLGNITEIRKNNALTNKYYYDEYSELIKEDDLVNKLTKEYTYDNYGNILRKKTYTYNTTNLISEDKYEYKNSNWQDLLTKFNNEQITYDEIGNPLTIGTKKLTWMNGRELSTYNDGTNNISYKYNLNGIRTSKIVNGIKTNYILEGTSIIFEDRNGTMLYYIYNGDELLGFVYNNNTYYYHKNIFGDIIGILDSNYNEVVSYEYDSWGALVNITDNSNINLGTINPFRYRSYYYDTDTSLYYLNSRYYNPQIGRFINADSIITGQGFEGNNMFVYCGNNPINRKDINGNIWKIINSIGNVFSSFFGAIFGQSASEDSGICNFLPTIIGTGVVLLMTVILIPEGVAMASVSIGAYITVAAYGAVAAATTKYIQGEINNNDDYVYDIASNTLLNTLTFGVNLKADILTSFVSNAAGSYLSSNIEYPSKSTNNIKNNVSSSASKNTFATATISNGKVTINYIPKNTFCSATISKGKVTMSSDCYSLPPLSAFSRYNPYRDLNFYNYMRKQLY